MDNIRYSINAKRICLLLLQNTEGRMVEWDAGLFNQQCEQGIKTFSIKRRVRGYPP